VPAQCSKFGYTPDDIWDFFINKIGNYAVYDFKGKRLPDQWQQIKGVMDRFFVPLELVVNEDASDVMHPGMGEAGFGKKKEKQIVQLNPAIFEE
jgi:hypothetical protein